MKSITFVLVLALTLTACTTAPTSSEIKGLKGLNFIQFEAHHCEHGDMESCHAAGSMMEKIAQTERDLEEASKFQQKACLGGIAKACKEIKK